MDLAKVWSALELEDRGDIVGGLRWKRMRFAVMLNEETVFRQDN